ncbi:hypothetical protein EMN47_04100 [Prolixibacteraceae bacterium JC049]|nr:hypothetical protein [Prolixibacteraceae bacterium JC049]
MKQTRKMNKITAIITLLACCIFSACDKMDDNYAQYIKDGETVYSPKALNLTAYAGYNRIQLSWSMTSIVNVSHCVIVPNTDNYQPLTVENLKDTMNCIFDGLAQGNYGFNVYSVDKSGNKSVINTVTANSYGDEYVETLKVSTIKNMVFNGDLLHFNVNGEYKNMIGYRLEYTKNDDTNVKAFFNKLTTNHVLEIKKGSKVKISSAYIPEENAIDTVYTKADVYMADEFYLDKSNFNLVGLPGDIPRFDPSVPDNEKDWYSAWDNDNTSKKVFLHKNNPKPAFITLDLGVETILTRYDVVGFSWKYITPRKYQLWGIGNIDDINNAATTTDIHDISSLSTEDQKDAEKVAAKKAKNFEAWKTEAANKGWRLLIDNNRDLVDATGYSETITEESPIKYVRIVFIDNFHNTNPDIGINEITFKGKIPTE